MAIQTYTVSYSTDDVTYTALTDVQNITVNIGRQEQLSQYNASTASVSLRYPTGFASPIASLVTGTFVKIVNTTSGKNTLIGTINNVNARYGIPYVGGVGNADFLDFSVECSFARLGRAQGNGYAMGAAVFASQLITASTQSGVNMFYSLASSPDMAGTTVSGTWGDWLNRSLMTTNSRMIDAQNTGVLVVSPFDYTVSAVNFSDTANDASNQVYDQIDFTSLADNYYTQVTVDPEGFAAQTVTQAGAVKPYRTLQTNTFNASTSQATDFANYLLGAYGAQTFAIGSFSCSAEAQNTFKLDQIGAGATSGASSVIGAQVSVAFRGTTFQCIVEGVTISATPAGSRYTYFVSGDALNDYLLLDNAVFGRLDFNRLGY
jgi:hypothetical protein